MFYKTFQRRWLVFPVVLTVVGSALKVVAQEPANTSTPEWQPTGSYREEQGQQGQKITCVSCNQSQAPFIDLTLSQVPRPITPRPPEQPTPTLPATQEEPLQLTPPTPPRPPNRPDIPGNITIERFDFVGNTAFSNEELAEVIKPFTGKPITFAELLQAEAAVSKKYTDAGYINSGAIIPANQTLAPSGAVVKIQIIEGGLEDIKVTGTRRLNSTYVRSRLRIATSRPLNREKLLEALQLLQLDPLIKNISAELSAGSRPELSLLEVKVQEADSFNTEFFADNGRTPSIGSFRRGVRINEGNVLGFGDSANFSYTNTDGSNAFDFSYTVPINPRNGIIKLAA
ncbi:MAG TPA: POTRA domain-containing protein, partial [Oculatellaceae cyanobacterium]